MTENEWMNKERRNSWKRNEKRDESPVMSEWGRERKSERKNDRVDRSDLREGMDERKIE